MSRRDRYRGSLRLLLAASATIWVSHFAAVYLVAEWRCRPGALDGRGDAGDAVTTGIVVALTVVGALAIVATTSYATVDGQSTGERELTYLARYLAAVFVFATVLVGGVALLVGPCS